MVSVALCLATISTYLLPLPSSAKSRASLTNFTVRSRPAEAYPVALDLKLSVMVLPLLIIRSRELFDGPLLDVQPVFADTSAVAEVLEPS